MQVVAQADYQRTHASDNHDHGHDEGRREPIRRRPRTTSCREKGASLFRCARPRAGATFPEVLLLPLGNL